MTSKELFLQLYNRLEPWHSILHDSQAIIGFSGGKDSFIILEFYQYLFDNHSIPTPIVFHLNHNIRNNREQEESIRKFMEGLEFPSVFQSKNIPALSTRIKKSLEETGRLLRYHSMEKLIRRNSDSIRYIVTGHHPFDYVESIFIHWIRGGGKNALSTLPVWNGTSFRPLMKIRDEELEFLIQNQDPNQIWEDESNIDLRFLRNRIRHNTIGPLQKEGLNFHRLYEFFHDSFHEKCTDTKSHTPSYLTIPKTTISAITSLQDWKTLLDVHLKLLKLHPPKKTTLEETFHLIQKRSAFQFSTKEFYLSRQDLTDIYIIPNHSPVFKPPRSVPKKNKIQVGWNQKLIFISREHSVTPPNAGEKIYRNGVNRPISEILRENQIPPRVRKFFPILRKDDKPIDILFELFAP